MRDVIHMAGQVDPVTKMLLDKGLAQGMDHETFVWFLERFAALVAAAEREACAKVCDVRAVQDGWEGCYADECAAEIRARGKG